MLPWSVVSATSSRASAIERAARWTQSFGGAPRSPVGRRRERRDGPSSSDVPALSISRHFRAAPATRGRARGASMNSARLTAAMSGFRRVTTSTGIFRALERPCTSMTLKPPTAMPWIMIACAWSPNWLARTTSIITRVAFAPSRRILPLMIPSTRVPEQTTPTSRTSPRCSRANGPSSKPITFMHARFSHEVRSCGAFLKRNGRPRRDSRFKCSPRPRAPPRYLDLYEVAGFGGPPKMLAALRFSAFAFSLSA